MKESALPGTNLSVPVLGFGCSSLMSQPDALARTALLDAAFESGIRHFDVARFYGYGEAEAALGNWIKPRRADVTVTTKFGIQPPAQTSALRHALGLARRVAAKSPLLRRGMAASAGKLVKRGNFSVEEARLSLETSLGQLKTGYIDFYLLHDCQAEDARSDDLLAFLQQSVAEGKIRWFGVGADIDDVLEIGRDNPEFARVVQFENSVLRQNRPKLLEAKDRAVITHRSLNESLERLAQFFASDAEASADWSRKLDVDCRDRDVLGAMMLNYAVWANPGGLVLFSSRSPGRIQKNAASVTASPFSPEQMALFGGINKEPALAS